MFVINRHSRLSSSLLLRFELACQHIELLELEGACITHTEHWRLLVLQPIIMLGVQMIFLSALSQDFGEELCHFILVDAAVVVQVNLAEDALILLFGEHEARLELGHVLLDETPDLFLVERARPVQIKCIPDLVDDDLDAGFLVISKIGRDDGSLERGQLSDQSRRR